MACKYHSTSWGTDYCSARSSSSPDKVSDYNHVRTYCTDSGSWWERCETYKKYAYSGGLCFITSACMRARGCPDNCPELTVFRKFRNEWLQAQPFGEEQIARYYHIAPAIVRAIEESGEALRVYEAIYINYIQPCVAFFEQADNETGYLLYKKMVDTLAVTYLADEAIPA